MRTCSCREMRRRDGGTAAKMKTPMISSKNQEPHTIHEFVLMKFVFSILPSRSKTENPHGKPARKTHIYRLERPREIIVCIVGTTILR